MEVQTQIEFVRVCFIVELLFSYEGICIKRVCSNQIYLYGIKINANFRVFPFRKLNNIWWLTFTPKFHSISFVNSNSKCIFKSLCYYVIFNIFYKAIWYSSFYELVLVFLWPYRCNVLCWKVFFNLSHDPLE